MRSALYYPHSEIRSKDFLKTALLLWDNVYTIAPFERYRPVYADSEMAEAFELIGKVHYPSTDERRTAHEMVEDFATRPLPASFFYQSLTPSDDVYELYPEKFFPETWTVLKQAGLVGVQLPNFDMPTVPATGLTLMSLLADCCAGNGLARVTDRSDAYAVLAGLFHASEDDVSATENLVPVSLRILDLGQTSFRQILSFRSRERSSADGLQLSALRRKYVTAIDQVLTDLATAKKGSLEWNDRIERFHMDMREDLHTLKSELRLEAGQQLGSKDIIATLVQSVTAIAAAVMGMPLPAAITGSGAIASIGGLLCTRSKFVKDRRDILARHPMAYLYELQGGVHL